MLGAAASCVSTPTQVGARAACCALIPMHQALAPHVLQLPLPPVVVQLQTAISNLSGRRDQRLFSWLRSVTLLLHAAGVVEQFAEKPGKGALRELTQGSKYSSETHPFEVTAAVVAGCWHRACRLESTAYCASPVQPPADHVRQL